jgi:hypothetical protein
MRRTRVRLIHLAIVFVWASGTTAWAQSLALRVAASRIEYAQHLAAEGNRIDSKDWKWMFDRAAELDGDTIDAHATRGLTAEQVAQLQRYVQLSYGPWMRWFNTEYDPCADKAPAASQARRKYMTTCIGFRSYLEAVARALETSRTELETYNLMLTLLSSVIVHIVTEFSYEEMEPPLLAAVKVFLRTASPPDVLRVLDRFRVSWIGLFPTPAEEFRRFSEAHPGLTSEQRADIASKATRRWLKE